MFEDLIKDPAKVAKQVRADLVEELRKLREKREREMLPWLQRRKESGHEGEQRGGNCILYSSSRGRHK